MCGHFVEKRLTSKEPHKLCERQDYLGNDGILLCYFPKKKMHFRFRLRSKKYVFFPSNRYRNKIIDLKGTS